MKAALLLLAMVAPAVGAQAQLPAPLRPDATLRLDPGIATPDAEDPAAAECEVRPDPEPGEEDAHAAPDASILEECGPVLKPPPTADEEIVEPPLQGGETPVIDP